MRAAATPQYSIASTKPGSLPCVTISHAMSLSPTIALAGLGVVIVTGCSTSTVPRLTTLQPTPQKASVKLPPPIIPPFGSHRLVPAETARPAKLKDDNHRLVSGDYAYVDLEAVLLLIGRIDGLPHVVTHVQFFQRVAASVLVEGYPLREYLCTKNADGVWSIVDERRSVY
jgi:hypothetical protein